MADKFEVASALRELGLLLELEGENPFKVRAYENGARTLDVLAEDLGVLVDEGRLTELPGIGEALAKKISELHRTGRLPLLEELRARHPPGIRALLEIPELGPKKVGALHAELGVGTVDDLERACLEGRVRGVKGFGARTEQKILENVRRWRNRGASRRVLLSDALAAGERLVAWLRESGIARQVDLAGSARRMKETVGDLDVVVAADDAAGVSERLVHFPLVEETLARGGTKTSVRLAGGLQVDLRVVPPVDYPTLLHHLTGSKGHHVKLRGIARDAGFTLSEWGLYRLPPGAPPSGTTEGPPPGSEKVALADEADLYRTLGMQPVPPELREDMGEVEAARAGELPEDLVTLADVRGMVHCHTTWSDGRASIEEMARGAAALGMEYLTITDHSRAAGYAGGLDRDRLLRQWEEIDRVQERVPVKLLRGTEADILEDGAIDLPEDLLDRLDVVVASIHSRMRMDEDAMTRRLVAAMRRPPFKIWGHARGRLLGEREPFACRVEEVLDALAASRGAVEVNGDPQRLEADPRMLRLAAERGIPVVLSVDAHSVAALAYLRLAVATARRGWVRRGAVLNTRSVDGFMGAVRPM
jgi:DNA polymerase (family 10)